MNEWKTSVPSLGMRGRKILLVGKFFGDGRAGFSECVVPHLGGRIDGFWSGGCGWENLPTHTIFLPSIGGFINRENGRVGPGRAGPCRAVGIERGEDVGAEPRNVGQENFVGRKIFRRLTSRLAATLIAVAVSEERGTGNDFSRRFRVRQIERLLLMPMRVQDWTNTGFLSPARRRFRM